MFIQSASQHATFDTTAAEACVEYITQVHQQCALTRAERDALESIQPPFACSRLFVGQLPVDAACTADTDCVSTLCRAGICLPKSITQPAKHGVLGDACDETCDVQPCPAVGDYTLSEYSHSSRTFSPSVLGASWGGGLGASCAGGFGASSAGGLWPVD